MDEFNANLMAVELRGIPIGEWQKFFKKTLDAIAKANATP